MIVLSEKKPTEKPDNIYPISKSDVHETAVWKVGAVFAHKGTKTSVRLFQSIFARINRFFAWKKEQSKQWTEMEESTPKEGEENYICVSFSGSGVIFIDYFQN